VRVQIIDLDRANSDSVVDSNVGAAAKRHGKCCGTVYAGGKPAQDRQTNTCSKRGMSATKQRMAENGIFSKARAKTAACDGPETGVVVGFSYLERIASVVSLLKSSQETHVHESKPPLAFFNGYKSFYGSRRGGVHFSTNICALAAWKEAEKSSAKGDPSDVLQLQVARF